MKALSLTQPWASLIAIQAKSIETRSWRTSYRGRIALHAAKGYPKWAQSFAEAVAARYFGSEPFECPTGVIVATAELVGCCPADRIGEHLQALHIRLSHPLEQEISFGDYGEGRWAWLLKDVQPVVPAVPAKGMQGLWNFSGDLA